MGNQPQNTKRLSKPTRYSRNSHNSYSLDESVMISRQIQPSSERDRAIPAPLILPVSQQLQLSQPSSPLETTTLKRSLTNPVSMQSSSKIKDLNDQKLAKLNIKNDQLRRQLIKISSQLTTRLGRKKFEEKKKGAEQQKSQPKELLALRRQLENAYRQIDRYRKLLEQRKNGESSANQQVLNEVQAKMNLLDYQIKQASLQVESAREIQKNQQKMIKKAQAQSNNVELKQLKLQIEKLRKVVKNNHKNERKKQQKERIMQEYMFQLDRKWRQMNGDYLPDIKSYANKNYVPDLKTDKRKKDQMLYKPQKWQIMNAMEQLKTLKEKHEEYHVKIQKSLKQKLTVRQGFEHLKEQYEASEKKLQNLLYRRDRYLQLVMGNVQFLMNQQDEDELEQSVQPQLQIRSIVKGNDLTEQIKFDDHGIIKDIPWSELKIVSINIWYTDKRQISVIQLVYARGKDCFLGGKTAAVAPGMQREELQVEEGDYIKNIMGSFNKRGAIQFLAFYSSKGKAKQFGREIMNGLNFTFGITKKQRPICISGFSFYDGSYWRINKLIVDVTTL